MNYSSPESLPFSLSPARHRLPEIQHPRKCVTESFSVREFIRDNLHCNGRTQHRARVYREGNILPGSWQNFRFTESETYTLERRQSARYSRERIVADIL